jgi:hypothetical protein
MNCEDFRAGRLEDGDSPAGPGHLETCPSCRARVADLDTGRVLLGDAAMWEEPSPELETQVGRLILANEPGPASKGPGRHRLGRLRGGRAFAAAAVAVVLAGVASYLALRSPAPDWEVAIPGTALAPSASAVVKGWNGEAGTRMLLTIEGLEPAPDGYVYEFWLSKGKLHTSAGTFAASGRFELRSGVTRAEFPRLWVTLEPLDEDEGPTTQTVLDTRP